MAWVVVQIVLHGAELRGTATSINPWMWPSSSPSMLEKMLKRCAIAGALTVLLAIWLAYWWAVAAGKYLRLPTPKRIAIAMACASLLAGATAHLWFVLLVW